VTALAQLIITKVKEIATHGKTQYTYINPILNQKSEEEINLMLEGKA
jgi:hypothetical protein